MEIDWSLKKVIGWGLMTDPKKVIDLGFSKGIERVFLEAKKKVVPEHKERSRLE